MKKRTKNIILGSMIGAFAASLATSYYLYSSIKKLFDDLEIKFEED